MDQIQTTEFYVNSMSTSQESNIEHVAADSKSVGLRDAIAGLVDERLDRSMDKQTQKETVERLPPIEPQSDWVQEKSKGDVMKQSSNPSLHGVYHDVTPMVRNGPGTPAVKEPKQTQTTDPARAKAVSSTPSVFTGQHNHTDAADGGPASGRKYATRFEHAKKTKVKTRGQANKEHAARGVARQGPAGDFQAVAGAAVIEPQQPLPPPAPQAPAPAPASAKIRVPWRVFRVFAVLLPSPHTRKFAAGQVGWDEFVYALNAIGLRPQYLHGSVCVFSPLAGEGGGGGGGPKFALHRSTQFHEPTEVRHGSKIARARLCDFGSRFRHVFGWATAEEIFEWY